MPGAASCTVTFTIFDAPKRLVTWIVSVWPALSSGQRNVIWVAEAFMILVADPLMVTVVRPLEPRPGRAGVCRAVPWMIDSEPGLQTCCVDKLAAFTTASICGTGEATSIATFCEV